MTKQTTKQTGDWAEDIACTFLVKNGYSIIARNVHLRLSEFDVVAWDGEILCFVEVRYRRSSLFGQP